MSLVCILAKSINTAIGEFHLNFELLSRPDVLFDLLLTIVKNDPSVLTAMSKELRSNSCLFIEFIGFVILLHFAFNDLS